MNEEPLHIEADSSDASSKGVAMVLQPIAETMADLGDGERYSFELTIEENE